MSRSIRVLAIACAFGLLAACSSEYIISTNAGVMITTDGKPKLDEKTGMYSYRDSEGRKATIKKEEVKQIMER